MITHAPRADGRLGAWAWRPWPAVLCLVADRGPGRRAVPGAAGGRAEVRAPVAGFLRAVYFDEGDRGLRRGPSSPGWRCRTWQPARPEAGRGARGPGPAAPAGGRAAPRGGRRAARAGGAGRGLARPGRQDDLAQARQALRRGPGPAGPADRPAPGRDGVRPASAGPVRSGRATDGAVAGSSCRRPRVATGSPGPARRRPRPRSGSGSRAGATLEAETELARREKELADAQAALTLLEAGTRPEEVEAERARLAGSRRRRATWSGSRRSCRCAAPWPGVVDHAAAAGEGRPVPPEGDLICVVEDADGLEVEVALAEQDVAGCGRARRSS